MQTLNAPIYEVKQDSDWYKAEKKRKEGINAFFDKFEKSTESRKASRFINLNISESMKEQKRMKYLKMTLLKIQKTDFTLSKNDLSILKKLNL